MKYRCTVFKNWFHAGAIEFWIDLTDIFRKLSIKNVSPPLVALDIMSIYIYNIYIYSVVNSFRRAKCLTFVMKFKCSMNGSFLNFLTK